MSIFEELNINQLPVYKLIFKEEVRMVRILRSTKINYFIK